MFSSTLVCISCPNDKSKTEIYICDILGLGGGSMSHQDLLLWFWPTRVEKTVSLVFLRWPFGPVINFSCIGQCSKYSTTQHTKPECIDESLYLHIAHFLWSNHRWHSSVWRCWFPMLHQDAHWLVCSSSLSMNTSTQVLKTQIHPNPPPPFTFASNGQNHKKNPSNSSKIRHILMSVISANYMHKYDNGKQGPKKTWEKWVKVQFTLNTDVSLFANLHLPLMLLQRCVHEDPKTGSTVCALAVANFFPHPVWTRSGNPESPVHTRHWSANSSVCKSMNTLQ